MQATFVNFHSYLPRTFQLQVPARVHVASIRVDSSSACHPVLYIPGSGVIRSVFQSRAQVYCQNGNIFISRGPTRRRRSMTGIDSSKSRTSRVCRSNSGQVRPHSQGGDVWSKLRNVCTFWGYVRAFIEAPPAPPPEALAVSDDLCSASERHDRDVVWHRYGCTLTVTPGGLTVKLPGMF